MTWRFRKSVRMAPGIRLNLGGRSASVSLGGRGIHHTIGTAGSSTSVGLPGSGLSYTARRRRRRPRSGISLGSIILAIAALGWLVSHLLH